MKEIFNFAVTKSRLMPQILLVLKLRGATFLKAKATITYMFDEVQGIT